MTDPYEIILLYQKLDTLCKKQGLVWEPEPGERIFFQGQSFLIAAADMNTFALTDDLTTLPLDSRRFVYVKRGTEAPVYTYTPNIEKILELIRRESSLFPSMIPGIHETKEVWRITHPNVPPILAPTLQEGLLDLALRILRGKDGL